jgi:O-methyltransferase
MIPYKVYLLNLALVETIIDIDGCVVECGVWRGGMMAGISELLGGEREYYLFDSFEGLPAAREIDGKAAIDWQNDTESPHYFDNCRAEERFAEEAMKKANAQNYKLFKGWFSNTLSAFAPTKRIACLRLDGDWYDSTMECLTHLFPLVEKNGLIIIDDYYVWDGCSRAVHDYLSKNELQEKIMQFQNSLAYIVKQ